MDSIFYDLTRRRWKIFLFLLGVFLAVLLLFVFSLIIEVERQSVNNKIKIEQNSNREKQVVLTFDDGPDKIYTPKILNILNNLDVRATFFVVGKNAIKNEEILRALSKNHEIGNHTFSHTYTGNASKTRLKYELALTNLIIRNATGKETVLFRPPYLDSGSMEDVINNEQIEEVQNLGFVTTDVDVDSKDWKNYGSQKIAEKVIYEVKSGKGNIILLHDAGGERKQTIEALPIIINALKKDGYEFVTASEFYSVKKEKTVFPIKKNIISQFNNIGIRSYQLTIKIFSGIFLGGMIFICLRFLFLFALASMNRKEKKVLTKKYKPKVSIIMPAYNEEEVIVKTLKALMKTNYPNYDVFVIDDGSSDKTYEKIKANFKNHDNLKIITLSHRGKTACLNYAIENSNSEIIITSDADTFFEKDTVKKLVKLFTDPQVAAVSGNIKVANKINLLTKIQAVEYIIGQGLERQAFNSLNSISVVPGATGAWRRSTVVELGGFSDQTLAEDADLTLKLLEKNYKVKYSLTAITKTLAPHSVTDFLKQRFRWVFGTFQVAWKYKHFLREPFSHKALVLYNFFIFQILYSLLGPIVDLLLISSLILLVLSVTENDFYAAQNYQNFIIYYLAFLGFDMLTAFLAFMLDSVENKKQIFWIAFQRFFYRQLLYFVTIKSLITAIKGNQVGWQKLKRKAS